MSFSALLMQLEPLAPVSEGVGRGWGSHLSDLGVVAAAGFGMGLVLLLWARFLRRRPRQHRSHGSSRRERAVEADPGASGEEGQEAVDDGGRKRRRRRAARREHRPRNPTLAETGGLPPSRAGDEPRL